MSDLGQVAYDAYSQSVGGVSKFTGEKLPTYADQDDAIWAAWQHAALTVRQEVIRVAVEAGDPAAIALQHAERGLGGQFLAGQLDKLATQLAKVEELVVDHRAECERLPASPSPADVRVDAAYQRGVVDRAEAYAEGYRHGREVGRSEAIVGELVVAASPTDYELWRDAWNLAAATSPPNFSPGAIRDNAEWFHDRLKAGPPRPSEPDCTHCGADSSMDHDDDCPHGENIGGAEPTAPPHDDGEYKRTVSSRIDD